MSLCIQEKPWRVYAVSVLVSHSWRMTATGIVQCNLSVAPASGIIVDGTVSACRPSEQLRNGFKGNTRETSDGRVERIWDFPNAYISSLNEVHRTQAMKYQ